MLFNISLLLKNILIACLACPRPGACTMRACRNARLPPTRMRQAHSFTQIPRKQFIKMWTHQPDPVPREPLRQPGLGEAPSPWRAAAPSPAAAPPAPRAAAATPAPALRAAASAAAAPAPRAARRRLRSSSVRAARRRLRSSSARAARRRLRGSARAATRMLRACAHAHRQTRPW